MSKLLTRRRYFRSLFLYLAFALLVMGLAPFIGSESLDLSNVFSGAKGAWGFSHPDAIIFFDYRLPRVLLGFLVGGSLALVGSAFQVIFRNPLAAPSTLGVTAAGSVGAFVAFAVPHLTLAAGPFSTVPLFALSGSALILTLIYLLARKSRGLSMYTLLLAGVTVGIFCSALVSP